ncbi:MAG: conserved phage C-terminal domain-containing protein [Actinobacteria bacterium]|nr:conserved phage C-terminal domain-containing protein [Actinomycetota bacterium]
MSIDDSVARDPRITELAKVLNWKRREVVGCLVQDVWPICYDQATHLVSARMIDSAADHQGFAEAMIECELARRDRSGKLRVSGARERVKYIKDKAEAGREGGIKSGISRRKGTKQNTKQPEAGGNPPDPVNPSAPDPIPANPNKTKNPLTPQGGLSCDSFFSVSSDSGETHQRTVAVVLEKLGGHSGTSFSGTPQHSKLIADRLSDGITELDLRKVVAYCALELGWRDKPDMKKYLRPETLFSPKGISKYLDAARSWSRTLDGIGELEHAQAVGGAA